jgi:hypothetical protein
VKECSCQSISFWDRERGRGGALVQEGSHGAKESTVAVFIWIDLPNSFCVPMSISSWSTFCSGLSSDGGIGGKRDMV